MHKYNIMPFHAKSASHSSCITARNCRKACNNKTNRLGIKRKLCKTRCRKNSSKRTRKIRGGKTIFQQISKTVGISSEALKWKEHDISKIIIPFLVHGRIITREKMMLRILTCVFIKLVCIDVFNCVKPKPDDPNRKECLKIYNGIEVDVYTILSKEIIANNKKITDMTTDEINLYFPGIHNIRSFKQTTNEVGDTLRTRDIPHLMAFFTEPQVTDKNNKIYVDQIKTRIFNIKKQVLDMAYNGTINESAYDNNGKFKYPEFETHVEYTLEHFLNSPNTDKKFGTYYESFGKYKACMVNTLGVSNLIDRRDKNETLDFKKYAKDTLKSYTIKYIEDISSKDDIDKEKIYNIIFTINYSFFFTYLYVVLLSCANAIFLQVYTDFAVPKCRNPIVMLVTILYFSNELFKKSLMKIADNSKVNVNDIRKTVSSIKFPTISLSSKLNSPPTQKQDIIPPYIMKLFMELYNAINTTMTPSFLQKQIISQLKVTFPSYYSEQETLYKNMEGFGAPGLKTPEIIIQDPNNPTIKINESGLSTLGNWLEPKNGLGIGEQELDFDTIKGLDIYREFAEVFHKTLSRCGATYNVTFNGQPIYSICGVINSVNKDLSIGKIPNDPVIYTDNPFKQTVSQPVS
jgi:hypothetical protein